MFPPEDRVRARLVKVANPQPTPPPKRREGTPRILPPPDSSAARAAVPPPRIRVGSAAPSPTSAASRIPWRHPSPSPRSGPVPPHRRARRPRRGSGASRPAASFPRARVALGAQPFRTRRPHHAHHGSRTHRDAGAPVPRAHAGLGCAPQSTSALGRLLGTLTLPPRSHCEETAVCYSVRRHRLVPAPASATGADSHTGAGRPASVEPNRPGRAPPAGARCICREAAAHWPAGGGACGAGPIEFRPGARRAAGGGAGLLQVIRPSRG